MLCQQSVSTLCSCSKQAHFAWKKLLTIIPVTWGDRDVTLRKKNSIDYLISTISGQNCINRRRRAEFGMTISDSPGPRKTYTEISSNDLSTVVKEILDILLLVH